MSSVSISFEARRDEPGFVIHDPIEGRTVPFRTPEPVRPEGLPTDGFVLPVDEACSIEASGLHLDTMVTVFVRSSDGEVIDRIRSHQQASFDRGVYHVDINTSIKIYLKIEGAVTFDAGADHLDIDLDDVRRVEIGARSFHERPATTITTTAEPDDLMAAITAFSSSLKTTSPLMSYPTLRGHPPLLEIGDRLSIPSGIEPKRTGVTIEVPPALRMIYPIASLAYYLGAEIRPGEPPRIVTEDGFEYPLVTERWFEDEVARVLKQTLFFDSIVRTKGPFGNDLYERTLVDGLLDRPLETLYRMPVAERLQEYLRVDFEEVRGVLPRWVMTAYVPPTGEGAAALPYLVNELAIIRNPRGTRIDAVEARTDLGVPTGPTRPFLNDGNHVRLLVRPELFDDSVEHVWFGEHVPIGATKGTIEAFEQKLNRRSKGHSLRIAVVSNDPGLVQEPDVLEEAYRGRGDLDYDIDTFVGVTTGELRRILETDYDFFHYIGETSPTGLHGTDGTIDVRRVNDVRVEAFLIDADHSFEEALALARNGAIGGIGTVGTVNRDDAITIGRAIARLLNVGFSLRGALDIVREQKTVGDQYVIVGDGSIDIAQPESAMPVIVDIETVGSNLFSVALDAYPAGIYRVGSIISPTFVDTKSDYLVPGQMKERLLMERDELETSLNWTYLPLRIDGKLYWNNTLNRNPRLN